MKPPFFPHLIVAVITSRSDYECIAGDLFEEYARHVARYARARADRWYWSQVVRSIPSLLFSSRFSESLSRRFATAATVLGMLLTMFIAGSLVNGLLDLVLLSGPASMTLHFAASWLVVILAGYALGALIREHSAVRLATEASLLFVAVFAIPSALRLSSPIYPLAWLLLLGIIPAMTCGASLHRMLQRR